MQRSPSSREDRFTALYARHCGAVRAFAWRRGPDEADDVVAETFLVAWRRLDEAERRATWAASADSPVS
jgi:DNA-directed RNA polymerase specialized sigma24 family protein